MSLETAIQNFIEENNYSNPNYGTEGHHIVVCYDNENSVRSRFIFTYDFSKDCLIPCECPPIPPTFDDVF